MIRRQPTKRGDKVKITFELPGEDDEVFVVGDFNGWSSAETPLRRRGDVRSASVTLVAGRRYAFRYYRAGKWFNDEDADEYEPNEFGESNGIIDLTGRLGGLPPPAPSTPVAREDVSGPPSLWAENPDRSRPPR